MWAWPARRCAYGVVRGAPRAPLPGQYVAGWQASPQSPHHSLQSQKPLFPVVLNSLQKCRFLFTSSRQTCSHGTKMTRNLPLAPVGGGGWLGPPWDPRTRPYAPIRRSKRLPPPQIIKFELFILWNRAPARCKTQLNH